jgi:hypothetical protein
MKTRYDDSRALAYMREHGTSYDLACILTGTRRVYPPHHEPAVAYMLDHPGTSYEAAVAVVKVRGPQAAAMDPFATPPNHNRVVAYMMAHPGMQYAQAMEQVGSVKAEKTSHQEDTGDDNEATKEFTYDEAMNALLEHRDSLPDSHPHAQKLDRAMDCFARMRR